MPPTEPVPVMLPLEGLTEPTPGDIIGARQAADLAYVDFRGDADAVLHRLDQSRARCLDPGCGQAVVGRLDPDA